MAYEAGWARSDPAVTGEGLMDRMADFYGRRLFFAFWVGAGFASTTVAAYIVTVVRLALG
jgi:hypothetical protein